jgi:hypothetical protein
MARSDIYEYHQQEEFPSNTGKKIGLLVVFGAFIGLGGYALLNLWDMHSTDITNIISTISPFLANNLWLLGAAVVAIVVLSILMAMGASVAAKRLGGTLIYMSRLVLDWRLVANADTRLVHTVHNIAIVHSV